MGDTLEFNDIHQESKGSWVGDFNFHSNMELEKRNTQQLVNRRVTPSAAV